MAENMIEKKVKSALPVYLAAGVFVLCALIFPIYKLWAVLVALVLALVTYAVADKKVPSRTVLVPAPPTVYTTGEAGLDATLAKAEQDLKTLAMLNDRIPEPQLSADISRMEKAGGAILTEVAKQPKKARLIRKFATYYLPTSLKLLTTYADLAASGAAGENAQSLMGEIKKNAGIIATAFEAQLDALFADKALDVSADISVLDGMMKGDGLSGQDPIGKAAAGAKATSVANVLAQDIAAGAAPGVNTTGAAVTSTEDPMTPHLTL